MNEKLELPLVSDLMITDVFTLSPDMTLEKVVTVLVKNKIPAAPVVVKKNGASELIGIISEKDCIEYLSNEVFYCYPDVTVGKMMQRFPLCVSPDTDLFTMATIFTSHGHKHLPVVKKKRLLGIVSRRDVLDGLFKFHKKVNKEEYKAKSPLDYHNLVNLRFIIK